MADEKISNAVALPTNRYNELAECRKLSSTLLKGSKGMRAAGEEYCPKHKAESQDTYNCRLAQSSLYNAYKDAVTKQTGKIFTEGITLNDDVPEALVTLCKNIDGQGRAITPFAMDSLWRAMADGVSFILVDFPVMPVGATLKDQYTTGARPYWCMVTADNLIGWRSEEQGGVTVISQVRIREDVAVPDGEFGERIAARVRVLMPNAYQVWERIEQVSADPRSERWILIEEGVTKAKVVTLVPVYTNRVGLLEGEPPLNSLAELNRDHWISTTENRHALMFMRFAMIVVKGIDTDKLAGVTVGPDHILGCPVDGDIKYIEHNGKAIEAGFKDLEQLEARMESAGMTVRIEQAGQVTATTSAINSEEHGAALKAIAKGFKDSLELALQYTADMMGVGKGGTVEVYDEFGDVLPEGNTADLQKLRASHDISRPTLWKELQRRRILSEDFNPEEEDKLIAKDVENDLNSMGPPPAPGTPFSGPPAKPANPQMRAVK